MGPARSCLLAAVVVLLLAVAVPAAAAKRKRCGAVCGEQVSRCRAMVAVQTACAVASGPARRACRRAQRKEQRGCRRRLLRACKSDPTPAICVAQDDLVGEPSAWETLLARLETTGEVSLETALQAFSLLIAPLPGVTLPDGALAGTAAAFGRDTGEMGGCAAVRWIDGYRDQLTAEQRAAVDAALAPSPAVLPQVRSVDGWTTDVAPAAEPDDAADARRFEQIAAEAAVAIAAKLGQPLMVPVEVVFEDPAKPNAAAALVPLDENGASVGRLTRCRMLIPARTRVNPDPTAVRGIVTHEVFHCFHAQIAGFTRYKNFAAPQWLDEGGPNWVAADLVGIFTSIDSSWRGWFEQPDVPLKTRAYSGHGIFAEVAWLGADPWPRFPELLKATTHDAVFALLSAGVTERLRRSWAASVLRLPTRGPEWDVQGNGVPPHAASPTFVTLPENAVELVEVAPHAARVYRVTAAAPNVLVDVQGGDVRIGDAVGRDVSAPAGTWLCTAPPCACPDGSPPPGTTIDVLPPLDVAVTGWASGAKGSFAGTSPPDRCKRDPNDPSGFCARLQPLATLGPALAEALYYGEPDDLRAAWIPWEETLSGALPAPAAIAVTWGRVLEAYALVTRTYYELIGYDIVDALVCDVGESPEECATEIVRSETYADTLAGYVSDLFAADDYLRATCGVQLALDVPEF
jgi:hypothetical protein